MQITIGSRGSELALTQTKWVQGQLLNLGLKTEIKIIETKGDQILDVALHKIGDKGLFTAELEEALRTGEIQLAVHSFKDLPTLASVELPIVAIPPRESPWDCVVFSQKFEGLASILDLPKKSIIGTSSLRRVQQLKHHRPDFEFLPIRGNVGTRLQKIKEGREGLCAGILAEAGLNRLGLQKVIGQVLPLELCIPAPAQGALAVQSSQKALDSYPELVEALKQINDTEDKVNLVKAERAALQAIEGGCQTPFAAYAQKINEKTFRIKGFIGDPKTNKVAFAEEIGELGDSIGIGKRLGLRLKNLI
ncbi:MAG: hydroxymethylbilane synthase [Candidatus Caenarcaniphilales bacterium]|nr:hydroxymethylbilane synthase [Candidatus Caenarcaniphilales bacterium]